MKELWDRSLKPEHFKAGFRASGLFPFSREAIPNTKLAASIPFNGKAREGEEEGEEKGEATEVFKLSCTDCGHNMTPVKLHVVAYLTKHIQAKPKARSNNNRKVKPTVYGEVFN